MAKPIFKNLADSIGNLIAPYLAKYLPLSGGTMSGALQFNTTMGVIKNVTGSSSLAFFVNNNTTGNANQAILVLDGTSAAPGPAQNGNISLGTSAKRWNGIFSKNGDFSGNLTVNGTINGTQVASLISIDDLKEVLTTEQFKAIDAKVQKRVVAFQKEQARLLAEAEQAELESSEVGTLESGDITRPSKPGVESNETV